MQSQVLAAAPAPQPIEVHHAAPVIRTRDGVRLFHRDWGEGQPIVFVSSWATPSEMWAYQVAHLSDAGFRCIAYDRRGHGRSDAPPVGYDMDTFADDLAAVLETLDLTDVVLVGHSMGCSEIIRYVGRHGSARVRKIVLIAPASPFIVQTDDNPYGAPMEYHEGLFATYRRDLPQWIEDNREPFFTPETSPAMQAWLIDQLLTTPPPIAIATLRANLMDLRPDLPKIDKPTLILHGTKDASAPIEATGARVAAGVKGAELRVYEDAPHGIFVTHMDRVNRDLETFARA